MRDSYTLYEDKLEGKYREAFKQIDTYFGTEKVDEDTREEYMGELLDIFLLAQEEGRPVEKITGNNIESFCKSFCSNLTWKQKVLSIVDLGKSVANAVFFISALTLVTAFFDMLSGESVNIWELRAGINVFGYICGFAIVIITSYLTAWVSRRIMFKVKKVSRKIWSFIVGTLAVVVSLFTIFIALTDKLDPFFDFPAWIACMGSGIYLLVYRICNRKRIAERKAHEVSFWEEVKKDTEFVPNTENVFSQEMEKKWEKKNAKRQKKGLPVFTREEILALEEAEVIKSEENTWVNWFFPIIITIGFVVFGKFETRTDMYWFVGIMLVVEYVLMVLLWKSAKSSNVNKRNWIAYERKKLEQSNNREA